MFAIEERLGSVVIGSLMLSSLLCSAVIIEELTYGVSWDTMWLRYVQIWLNMSVVRWIVFVGLHVCTECDCSGVVAVVVVVVVVDIADEDEDEEDEDEDGGGGGNRTRGRVIGSED